MFNILATKATKDADALNYDTIKDFLLFRIPATLLK
jgi:hypothetical protein